MILQIHDSIKKIILSFLVNRLLMLCPDNIYIYKCFFSKIGVFFKL